MKSDKQIRLWRASLISDVNQFFRNSEDELALLAKQRFPVLDTDTAKRDELLRFLINDTIETTLKTRF